MKECSLFLPIKVRFCTEEHFSMVLRYNLGRNCNGKDIVLEFSRIGYTTQYREFPSSSGEVAVEDIYKILYGETTKWGEKFAHGSGKMSEP